MFPPACARAHAGISGCKATSADQAAKLTSSVSFRVAAHGAPGSYLQGCS
ncbi:unnamed protein product [Penicillium roqueforti FM164]|uniref:Genomic scaffold, ProqFM164S01 n=1 Tax=Penicillium roqueforti (strain FM164) TaxID=1365484 RepID=W6QDC4_PENRF|nr:unnamed protein product [Penicillium roqueforti FM164]